MKFLYPIIISYLALIAFAYFFSEQLIFVPPKANYQDDPAIIKLITPSKITIAALHLINPNATYTVLMSHGNAEDLGSTYYFLKAWQRHGFSVFAYDYPGYGVSSGTPSEKSAYAAANTAYNYLTQTLKIPPDHIIVYGRSLGGALAIDLAAKHRVAAIIEESTFLSAFRVMTRFKILPFDRFDNLSKLKNITAPILFMHGMRDTIVPFWHGTELYSEYQGPKANFWVPNANHNDMLAIAGEEKYFQAINNFIVNFVTILNTKKISELQKGKLK